MSNQVNCCPCLQNEKYSMPKVTNILAKLDNGDIIEGKCVVINGQAKFMIPKRERFSEINSNIRNNINYDGLILDFAS